MLNILNHQILKSRVVGWKYRSVVFEHFIDILLDSGQTFPIFIRGGDMYRQNEDKEYAKGEYARLDKYLREELKLPSVEHKNSFQEDEEAYKRAHQHGIW